MKYLLVCFLTLCFLPSILLHAQQNHFIYLQTDNKQPFYIKLDNNVLSSSSAGYLIIGKLTEGNYKLVIGFPKSEWPEQTINISAGRQDAGFLLKNFGEKGWGLYNIQTSEVLMAGNIAIQQERIHQAMESDPFSTMLANVVNDSTILQKDIVKDDLPNKQLEIKTDEPKEITTSVVTDSSIIKTDMTLSVIKRTLRKKNKEGTELVYVDKFDNSTDTIRIFIPVEKIVKKDSIKNGDVAVKTDSIIENKEVPVKIDTLLIQKEVVLNNDSIHGKKQNTNLDEVKTQEQKVSNETKQDLKPDKPQEKEYKFIEDKKEKTAITKSTMINSDCKAFAVEEDFLKLRKKMAAENNDENMIKVAKKSFKSKCYSTELIKNLSTLFLKDEGKYMFFDAAYPFVTDSESFPTLQGQLSDSYYINRFNAMVHK